jgi:hypothetical protein
VNSIDAGTLAWANQRLLRLATPFPRYGSAAWWDEPDDPIRRASILFAAECWRRDGLPEEIARRLEAELQARRDAEDTHYADLHAGAQQIVRNLVRGHDGLAYADRRARAIEEAGRPRPDDFPGRRHLRGGAA